MIIFNIIPISDLKKSIETLNLLTVLNLNEFYVPCVVSVESPPDVAVFDDFRAGVMKPEEFINFIDYNLKYINGGIQRLSSIYRNVEDYVRCETMGKKNKCNFQLVTEPSFNDFENYEITADSSDNTRVIIN
ncbi:hypothetical protein H8356DRAFT_1324222 [Neocallimastix lanati (nom. inval.)]|nr:hypothetical protein H8356DRAFT_1324222 [Neocallimastix sp. JGI-2020a]